MGNLSNGSLEDEPSYSQYYTSGKRIANGTFACVKMCKRKADKKLFAVKIIKKTELREHELSKIKEEVNILNYLNFKPHPNIITMHQVFEDEHKLRIILELCRNDNLLDQLCASPNKRFTESKAAKITYRIAKTLQYLHANNVVHRDLKPENIVFTKEGILKITDFGSAKHVHCEGNDTKNLSMKTKVGTPYYVAPELLTDIDSAYNEKIDLWSLGVMLYVMLSGVQPFSARKGLKRLYSNIQKANYSFKAKVWNGISDDAIDLIQKLLTVDVSQRMSCQELLKHKWILKYM